MWELPPTLPTIHGWAVDQTDPFWKVDSPTETINFDRSQVNSICKVDLFRGRWSFDFEYRSFLTDNDEPNLDRKELQRGKEAEIFQSANCGHIMGESR